MDRRALILSGLAAAGTAGCTTTPQGPVAPPPRAGGPQPGAGPAETFTAAAAVAAVAGAMLVLLPDRERRTA